MKNGRVKIALGVFLSIILLTVLSVVTVRRSCMHLIGDALVIADAAEREDDPATRAAIDILQQDWKHESNILRFFVPCETLSSLNQSVFRLEPLYDAGCDELRSELQAVKAALQWIHGMELTVF